MVSRIGGSSPIRFQPNQNQAAKVDKGANNKVSVKGNEQNQNQSSKFNACNARFGACNAAFGVNRNNAKKV